MPVKTNGATLPFCAPRQAAVGRHVEIALAAMIARARLRHQQQQRVHFLLAPLRGEQAQRVGRAVDPDNCRC